MKIPHWAKNRNGMFWIWVFLSAFIAGIFKSTLDLNNFFQYILFYTICLILGWVLCWIQNFYRHNEFVEKEIKKNFDKKFPNASWEKEIMNHLREKLKEIEDEDAKRTRHLWN